MPEHLRLMNAVERLLKYVRLRAFNLKIELYEDIHRTREHLPMAYFIYHNETNILRRLDVLQIMTGCYEPNSITEYDNNSKHLVKNELSYATEVAMYARVLNNDMRWKSKAIGSSDNLKLFELGQIPSAHETKPSTRCSLGPRRLTCPINSRHRRM